MWSIRPYCKAQYSPPTPTRRNCRVESRRRRRRVLGLESDRRACGENWVKYRLTGLRLKDVIHIIRQGVGGVAERVEVLPISAGRRTFARLAALEIRDASIV